MGLFDIFTNTPAATPAAPVVAPVPGVPVAPVPPGAQGAIPPGNIPPPADPAAPGQGVVPASAVVDPAAPAQSEHPLDQFKDLWQPIPVDPNAPAPVVPAELTAEQVQQAVAKASFTQAITPEQLTAIAAGGEGATTAFTEALNAVAQAVMVQSTMVGNKLTEKAVAAALEKQSATIPGMLREQASTAHLNDTSALFSNPAIQPVVQATQAQLLQKFPNASPAEITTMTQDFIKAMGEQFAPKPEPAPGDVDWSKFLQ